MDASGKARRRLNSGRHLPAAVGTSAARIDAVLHVAEPLTVLGAFVANLGTFSADVLVMCRFQQHEMRCGSADLGTGEHEPEVFWLRMLAAGDRKSTRLNSSHYCTSRMPSYA